MKNGRRKSVTKDVVLLIFFFWGLVSLVFAGGGIEQEPLTFEIIRNSVAFDSNFNQVAVNAIRYEEICIAGRPTVTVSDTQFPLFAFDVDGDLVICGSSGILYTTTNGVDFNELVNIFEDEPFSTYFTIGSEIIKSVHVMADGSWLLVADYATVGSHGYLFRSQDKGHTWTYVLTLERGNVQFFGWCGVRDNEVAIGEYGKKEQPDNPRRVYYSQDYGATWYKIYEPNAHYTPGGGGEHCHLVAFSPTSTDVLYVVYGDGEWAEIRKLEYHPGEGGKTNINNWSEANNSPVVSEISVNPVTAFSDGQCLYFGHDGSSLYGMLNRLDPCDDSYHIVFNLPGYNSSQNDPYRTGNPNVDVYSVIEHDGVYYASGYASAYPMRTGGIYVSDNLKNWVCAYRTEWTPGFYYLAGYAGGYIWGTYIYGVNKLFKMTPIEANTVTAVRCERGVTNIFNNSDDSSFESSIGGWKFQLDVDTSGSGRTTEESLHGDSSLKIVCDDKHKGLARVQSEKWSDMGGNPSVGDYVCASFWIKGAPSWPDEYSSYADISVVWGGQIDFQQAYLNVTDDWQKVTIWGRCTEAITGYVQLRVMFDDNGYTGNFSDATCYIDCVQVNYTSNLHNSGSWQLGGVSRDNEYGRQNITGLGKEFKTTFEWWPEIASREWHGGRISIASWTDGVDYIDLYYDADSSKFMASDGWHTVATVNNYEWEHLDSIKFSLANEIGDFNLSVESPFLGREQRVSSGTLLGRPVEVKFGTDCSGTGYSSGLIGDVHHFDEGTGGPEPNLPGDLTGDGIVNFGDFAVFAVRWLELGCGEPDWCQGADIDKNGVVDFSDLYIFVEDWLEKI